MPGERAHGACHLASHAMGPISVYIDINIHIFDIMKSKRGNL
jgi:hypothetical protein